MAIQKEIWLSDIAEKLYAGNEFITKAVIHDAFVDNKTVHIPQSGTIPAVSKNRAVLPAVISQRTDTDKTYDLNEYTTDPILVTKIEEMQVNYDKRMSLMNQHIRSLGDRIGLQTAYDWSTDNASSRIFRTTGTATAYALAPSATGTRKALTLTDIARAAAQLDDDNVPAENRWMLLPSKIYWEMVTSQTNLLSKDYMDVANLPSGAVNKILGFNIMLRSYTLVYDATPNRKAVGAAGAATDNYGIVAWQQEAVCKALGAIKIFADEDKPDYYGSVLSGLVMHGSDKIRTDLYGVCNIVQTA